MPAGRFCNGSMADIARPSVADRQVGNVALTDGGDDSLGLLLAHPATRQGGNDGAVDLGLVLAVGFAPGDLVGPGLLFGNNALALLIGGTLGAGLGFCLLPLGPLGATLQFQLATLCGCPLLPGLLLGRFALAPGGRLSMLAGALLGLTSDLLFPLALGPLFGLLAKPRQLGRLGFPLLSRCDLRLQRRERGVLRLGSVQLELSERLVDLRSLDLLQAVAQRSST